MSLNDTFAVQSARDLGPQFRENPNRMGGQDGAYSIPLDEDALWFFGDTLIGERDADAPMPHGLELREYEGFEDMIFNCGLRCRDATGAGGLTDFEYVLDDDGEIRYLVELLPEEDPDRDRIWCLDGCYVDGTVYLYYIKVEMFEVDDGPFPMGFRLVGSGVASGDPDDLEFERATHDGSTMLWPKQPEADRDDPHFASAVHAEPEAGWVYVYGAASGEQYIDRCYVGRVATDSVTDVTAYEYYAGDDEWVGSLDDGAVPVFDGMPNEMSVSYNEHLGSYLAVHSLGLTGQVVGRTAPTPVGPWSPPTILWTVEPAHVEFPSQVPTYAAKEHPELAADGGRTVYVTYVDFDEYYPHLVEVTLA